MRPWLSVLGAALALWLLSWDAAAETVVHHQLQVSLTPEDGRLQVRDIITLPSLKGPLQFSLYRSFVPTSPDPGVRIEAEPGAGSSADGTRYRLFLPPGGDKLTLDYGGKLFHRAEDMATAVGHDQRETLGFIASNGVYLDGNSRWYPRFGDELVTFSMTVQTPPTWRTISQGRQITQIPGTGWRENHPQEEIYLLSGPYHDYHLAAGGIDMEVMLRSPDPDLANQYLSGIAGYIEMYNRLLGPYPYGKFAVVENSRETGYGMPSFTLLGSRVMRLPFIPYTSLPHEILHNWWGNGVYVDYGSGNWSEGLTAYLADYLLREQAGDGAAYRRNALLRYTNYVSDMTDFPIKNFQDRHSEASQAVGYDKALMLFHMVRMQLGDKDFIAALREFYRIFQFHRASWDDLRHAFEAAGHLSLQSEFEQWLTRRGAPELQVRMASAKPKGKDYELTAVIEQTQRDAPYRLRIPIAVQLDGWRQVWQSQIEVNRKQQSIKVTVPARPWRLQVDPEFDVFRRLDPGELPPTLGEALGAESLLIVLPSSASAEMRDAYRQLAQSWAEAGTGIEIRWDAELQRLPSHRAVWLLGWDNRFLGQVAKGMGTQLSLSNTQALFGGQSLSSEKQSVVISVHNNGAILVWMGCNNPTAITGLARKLPHYGSYSYLAFQGNAPDNILKGQWQVLDSPLQIKVKQEDNATAPNIPMQLAPRLALISK